ncbi:MAG: AAA family ATPase [Oscillospiraceae bacterium]|nr:AAA family ATPase [Oscillospiraceae bacterium]
MAYSIAVAGKGGTGKTTVCGLIINYLAEYGGGPVLAVDADANSNLNEVLGVEVETTLGEIREEVAKGDGFVPTGMSKQDYTEYRFEDALSERDGYDLLVMGRTQGQGCYCFVNGLLQTQIARYAGGYKYMVVDNEAGMEHISRGILPQVNVILLVSDCSRRGIQAVGRIKELIADVGLKTDRIGLIVNMVPEDGLADGIREEIEKYGLELFAAIPRDRAVYEYDSSGKALVGLPEDNPVKQAVSRLMRKLEAERTA